MANLKKLSGDKRKENINLLLKKIEYLNSKTIPEKTLYLVGIYRRTFKKQMPPDLLSYGEKNIIEYLISSKQLYVLSKKQIQDVYQAEFKFIADLSGSRKAPAYLVRQLALNFINNLDGQSRSQIPGAEDSLDESQIEDYRNQMNLIYSTSLDKNEPSVIHKSINQKILIHILRCPFYELDLKALLLRAEDPKGRKGLLVHQIEGFNDYPYRAWKKPIITQTLEQYLVLADQLDLSKDISELDKLSMPVRDERIYDIILELRSKGTKDQIHGELRKIFSPSY